MKIIARRLASGFMVLLENGLAFTYSPGRPEMTSPIMEIGSLNVGGYWTEESGIVRDDIQEYYQIALGLTEKMEEERNA